MKMNKNSKMLQELDDKLSIQLIDLIEEQSSAQPSLVSKAAKRQQIKQNLHDVRQQWSEKLQNGIKYLEEAIFALAAQAPELFTDEKIKAMASRLKNHLLVATREPLQNATDDSDKRHHFDQESLQLYYQAAQLIYQQQDYVKASAIFTVLVLLDDSCYELWLGLGHCEYLLHNYSGSLTAYAMAMQVDSTRPMALYRSALCYEKTNDLANSVNSLEMAIKIADLDLATHREIKKASEKFLSRLKNKK